jgi:hypothetical protein
MNSNLVNVTAINSAGELPDCSVNRATIQTKYKHSPTASLAAGMSEDKFTVYPNPSSGSITLSFGKGKLGILSIYNAQGQLVQQANIVSGERYTAAKLLPAGLYFIEVFSDGDKRTSKLIISN